VSFTSEGGQIWYLEYHWRSRLQCITHVI